MTLLSQPDFPRQESIQNKSPVNRANKLKVSKFIVSKSRILTCFFFKSPISEILPFISAKKNTIVSARKSVHANAKLSLLKLKHNV